jgi:hypothetical protein
MRTFLEDCTAEQISDRKALLEAKRSEIGARIAAGEKGDVTTQRMVRGSWVNVSNLEHSFNSLGHALDMVRIEEARRH